MREVAVAMSLVRFYLNDSPDHAGQMISDIWAFSLDDLEFHHDFIQWLFPLEVPSPVNPLAPTLDERALDEFRTDPALHQNLLRSLDLMLNFYGLERIASPPLTIVRGKNFAERSANWLTPGNHNHLRLTRILHCLALCGLEPESAAFLKCLLEIAKEYPRDITQTTLDFWRRAVRA